MFWDHKSMHSYCNYSDPLILLRWLSVSPQLRLQGCDQRVVSKIDINNPDNLIFDTVKQICAVDSAKMLYIKDLYLKKYGKPDNSFSNYDPSGDLPTFTCVEFSWSQDNTLLNVSIHKKNPLFFSGINQGLDNNSFTLSIKYTSLKNIDGQSKEKEKNKQSDNKNI